MKIEAQIIRDRPNLWISILKCLRPHHWAKNVLVFVPLLAGHYFLSWPHWEKAFLAFLSFSFAASSIYIINDLLDLEADRKHTTKKFRPLAHGDLSIKSGLLLAPILLGMAIGVASFLPQSFSALILGYFLVNLLYSTRLKKIVMMDVIGLATMYAIRVLGGGTACSIPVSQWLMAFSIFLFYGLATIKRFDELQNSSDKVPGRDYSKTDAPAVLVLGVSGSFMSVLVLALYFNSTDVSRLYHHSERLWMLLPLMLYWLSHLWIQVCRHEVDDDPVLFVLGDRVSWLVGLLFALTLFWSL